MSCRVNAKKEKVRGSPPTLFNVWCFWAAAVYVVGLFKPKLKI